MRFRVHFEPEDIECDNIEDIQSIVRQKYITIRKIVPIDKDGFPVSF